MSSYRSYVPWKSNLPTTSYKAGSGSAYSSRDDVSTGNNTDNKSTARFGSITSPATYRPSYSGGTYRSAKSTRDSTTSSPSTYISRYATTKNEKEKPVESARKVQVTQSKYVGNTSNKENDNKISRFSTSTGNLTRYGQKSRDPSPAIDRRPQIAITRVRSREPSPVRSSLRARSRDPSPADVTLKTRIGTPTNGYTSPYRLCPRTSSNYTSRLANSNTSLPRSTLPEKALSYMSASDIRARPKTRIHNCTGSKAKQEIIEEVSSATTTSSLSTDSKEQKSSAKEISDDPEVFFPVMVVCRGTSPTPPGSASFVRARRTDLAKTIEKTIQRSSRKIQCVDKEIQSDRLDDSTRYCRHSAAGRLSSIPYSGYVENKFNSGSSRYSGSSGSAKTSRDSISKSENDNIDKKKIDDSTSSKNSSSRNSSKQEKSKSSSESKTKSTSSKQISNKQKSPDSLGSNSSRSLPPTIPKLDSPTKTITSVSSNKWPNKDFRKSALNVGPTDRPRKSRTPSTGTDSAEEQLPKYLINVNTRSSRSPSVGSEVSSASTTTISSSSENDQKRSHETKKITTSTTTSSVSHHQENTPLSIEKNVSYNKITGTNSSDGVSDEIHDVNINVGIREDKQQKLQQKINFPQNSLQTNSLNESSPVSKNAEAKSFLIQKLGSVSNFFATLTQDNSDETIHLDNSSSNSLSNESKQGGIIPIIGTVSQYLNSTATTATNHNNTINTSDNTYSKSETDIEDSSWWLNTSQQINTESALDVCDEMKYKLRHIDSGEIAWWNQNHEDDTIGDDLKTLNQDDQDHSENTDRSFYRSKHGSSSAGGGSAERSWWTLSENEVTSDKGSNNNNNTSENSAKYKIKQPDAEEPPPWWNHENSENNRNGVNQRAWWINENSKSPHELNDSFQDNNNKNHFKIQHADSGEAPWWMSNENSNESPKPQVEVTHNIRNQLKARYTIDSNEPPPWSNNDCTNNSSKNSPKNTSDHSQHSEDSATKGLQPAWWMVNNNSNKKLFKVRHIESGEKSWWLQDDPQETSQLSNHIEENESDVSDDDDDDDDDDDEVQHVIINNNYNKQNMYHDERLPLGDRASPEGLEDSSKGRKSPYDNIPSSKTRTLNKAQKLFISRHQNIDDILGGSCRPISPLMDRFSGKNSFMEEITPAQVRIHDSTAQMPIIQRVETDNNWNYSGSKLQPRENDKVPFYQPL